MAQITRGEYRHQEILSGFWHKNVSKWECYSPGAAKISWLIRNLDCTQSCNRTALEAGAAIGQLIPGEKGVLKALSGGFLKLRCGGGWSLHRI